jgi:hypothetical protein
VHLDRAVVLDREHEEPHGRVDRVVGERDVEAGGRLDRASCPPCFDRDPDALGDAVQREIAGDRQLDPLALLWLRPDVDGLREGEACIELSRRSSSLRRAVTSTVIESSVIDVPSIVIVRDTS